jgi:hypothetical protein
MPHSPPIATPNKARRMRNTMQIRREGRGKSERRVKQHVDHHDRTAPEAVGETPEDECADGTHRKRQCDRPAQGPDRDAEIPWRCRSAPTPEEKIERIERPAEIAGGHDMLLLCGPALQRLECHDLAPEFRTSVSKALRSRDQRCFRLRHDFVTRHAGRDLDDLRPPSPRRTRQDW